MTARIRSMMLIAGIAAAYSVQAQANSSVDASKERTQGAGLAGRDGRTGMFPSGAGGVRRSLGTVSSMEGGSERGSWRILRTVCLSALSKCQRIDAGIGFGCLWRYLSLPGKLGSVCARHRTPRSAEKSANARLEYKVRADQFAAFGAGWAESSNSLLKDEYVLEASYRWQVTPAVSLTPDLQVLFNPSKYPNEDVVWVGGLRCILVL